MRPGATGRDTPPPSDRPGAHPPNSGVSRALTGDAREQIIICWPIATPFTAEEIDECDPQARPDGRRGDGVRPVRLRQGRTQEGRSPQGRGSSSNSSSRRCRRGEDRPRRPAHRGHRAPRQGRRERRAPRRRGAHGPQPQDRRQEGQIRAHERRRPGRPEDGPDDRAKVCRREGRRCGRTPELGRVDPRVGRLQRRVASP